MITDELRTPGVFFFADGMSAPDAAGFARRIEELGYSTIWVPDTFGREPFSFLSHVAGATESILLATGIANIYNRHPNVMQQGAVTLAELTGGRFICGLGVSHKMMVEGVRGLDYKKPVSTMRSYLDAMDQTPVYGQQPGEPPLRVLAALRPKMLALAGERTDGAHPYFTTPEHTRRAREILGPDKLLCVEQKVVLSTDADAARAAARAELEAYVPMPNYRNNWKWLGFTDAQIDARDDAFVDALVAWGDADALRQRIGEHVEAGASHVCVQPVSLGSPRTPDMAALEALAPAGA